MAEYRPGPHTTPLLLGDHLYTIGAKLYLRDRKNILALDLSPESAGAGMTN